MKIVINTVCVDVGRFCTKESIAQNILEAGQKGHPFAGSVVTTSGTTILIFQQVIFLPEESKDEKDLHGSDHGGRTEKNNESAPN